MINNFIEWVQNGMLAIFKSPELVTILISILPIVEARGAIPIAMGYGIPAPLAWLYSFLGSSLIVPILLLILLPIINWLGKTRLFKKAAHVIFDKFEKKSDKIIADSQKNLTADSQSEEEKIKAAKKLEWKKIIGVFLFVAIPLPLTGVWTGSAVAAILKIKYPKAIAAIIAGNLVASGIITILCVFFSAYIDYIILAIGIIAIVVVLTLIIKIILHRPAKKSEQNTTAIKEEKE